MVATLRRTVGAANLLVFAYDWRLSNEHNALLLRRAVQSRWPDAPQSGRRLAILTHGMGGLIARYYIE